VNDLEFDYSNALDTIAGLRLELAEARAEVERLEAELGESMSVAVRATQELARAVSVAEKVNAELTRLRGIIERAVAYGRTVLQHPAYVRVDTVPQNDFDNLLALLSGATEGEP
jgi:hypothetical protein